MTKAYYYENNGYNGILLISGNRFISIADIIDGIEIIRENIQKIVKNFTEYGLDDNDFNTMFNQASGKMIYGENANKAIEDQNTCEKIYTG